MAQSEDANSRAKASQRFKTLDSFQSVRPVSESPSATALAVLNSEPNARSSRPRRVASKKASHSIVSSIDPTVGDEEGDDNDDFVPEEAMDEDEDEDEEQPDDPATEDNEDFMEIEPPQRNKKAVTKGKSMRAKPTTVAKRGRKPKLLDLSVDSDTKSPTPLSKLDNKRRVIRALKDLTSARDKIERIYGLNPEKLLKLAKVKEAFETGPFDFDLDALQEGSKCYVDFPSPCCRGYATNLTSLRSASYHVIELSEFQELFALSECEIPLLIGDLDTHIKTGQKIEFPTFSCGNRKGFVYNVGGLVTDMAWLPREDTDSLFLALSISSRLGAPVDSDLRCWGEESHESCIAVYEVCPDSLSFEKYLTIVHNFGETWDLKWHAGFKDETALGMLAACCQDGSVRFIKIDKAACHEFRKYDSSDFRVAIPQTPISCFDFTSSDTIVCGFQNGNVAEFQLGSDMPSYYHKIHDSYIISIVAAYSDCEDTVISTTSVDGFISAFNPKNIRTTKASLGRVRGGNTTIATYCPPVYGVVYSDGVNSVKAYTPRAIFAPHQICQHENTVSSLGASRLHPFLLSGSSDGTLMINNLARRFLTGIKNNVAVYKYLKLWQWDFGTAEKKYRLNPNYAVFKFSVNEVSKARVSPQGVNITCCKWNETRAGGKFYSFVNNAGLLVIEELGREL
ncbi:LADA_0B03158g1_1 [Lachancea dasiensis]|uniref:LADA_0B03158g1_1 n=1 Tax=Lachancea dasiensis TaxID=1072105 RepID=A0A1G4ISB3_9SACH|nr:LADA_0B03158g1_1 [Lachancea dasiensis]